MLMTISRSLKRRLLSLLRGKRGKSQSHRRHAHHSHQRDTTTQN